MIGPERRAFPISMADCFDAQRLWDSGHRRTHVTVDRNSPCARPARGRERRVRKAIGEAALQVLQLRKTFRAESIEEPRQL